MLGVTLRSEPGQKGATGSRSKMWEGGEGSLGRKRLIQKGKAMKCGRKAGAELPNLWV